jgi:hypothetical protein
MRIQPFLGIALTFCVTSPMFGQSLPPVSHTPGTVSVQAGDPNSGLWFGIIPVCRGTVIDVSITKDETGFSALVLRFTPESQKLILRETERLVGQAMPVRLDGRTIFEPIVREPISSGTLQLAGSKEGDVRQIEKAALRPCAQPVLQAEQNPLVK